MKKFLAALIGLGLLFALVSCSSTKAYASQCAYVIGNGQGDSHQIKHIVHPGEQIGDLGDDIAEFVPCGARNFLITQQKDTGDRDTPALGRTASANSGKTPSLPVKANLRSFFTLNQSDDALKAFLPFCEKYACYSTDGDKLSGDANFSTPGWNGMLRENYSLVIDKVFRDSVSQFPPTIWQDEADWPKVAEAMSKNFKNEMRKATGSNQDFFCGSWFVDENRVETCTDVRFEIDLITPEDPAVAQIQQQTALAEQQKALNDAKATATKTRYGTLSDYYNGLQDTIAACKDAGQSCTIIIGGSGNVNVNPRQP